MRCKIAFSGLLASFFLLVSVHGSLAAPDNNFGLQLAAAAMKSAGADIVYNGAYTSLSYPFGDVPAGQGGCTDVVIRAYRGVGVDLQKRIHEDMKAGFAAYPSRRVWGLTRPDRNIDHRRVLNMVTFFKGQEAALPVTDLAADYLPGDLVYWNVPKYGGGVTPHMGVVTAVKTSQGEPMIVHHLSGKPLLENVLFAWPVKGHFRYQVAKGERDR